MPKVLFHVQHLLGTGHLQRAAIISRELAGNGWQVRLLSGGRRVPTLDVGDATLIQLAPIHALNGDFAHLVDEHDNPVEPALWASRATQTHTELRDFAPDIVVTETFPFGRRSLRHELLPFIQAAKSQGCQVVCSVRDILQSGRQEKRLKEARDWANQLYDLILIHGDRAFCEFGTTFPLVDQLTVALTYTGFVAPTPSARAQDAAHVQPLSQVDIVVSAGGGAVGARIYKSVLGAARLADLCERQFLILVGRNYGEDGMHKLRALAGPNVSVQWARPDFRQLLQSARVSISQAGYNTVLDLMNARVPSVVIPYQGGGETEQILRAQCLLRYQPARLVREDELSADSLRAAIVSLGESACDEHPNAAPSIQSQPDPQEKVSLDGAQNSVSALRARLQGTDTDKGCPV